MAEQPQRIIQKKHRLIVDENNDDEMSSVVNVEFVEESSFKKSSAFETLKAKFP